MRHSAFSLPFLRFKIEEKILKLISLVPLDFSIQSYSKSKYHSCQSTNFGWGGNNHFTSTSWTSHLPTAPNKNTAPFLLDWKDIRIYPIFHQVWRLNLMIVLKDIDLLFIDQNLKGFLAVVSSGKLVKPIASK